MPLHFVAAVAVAIVFAGSATAAPDGGRTASDSGGTAAAEAPEVAAPSPNATGSFSGDQWFVIASSRTLELANAIGALFGDHRAHVVTAKSGLYPVVFDTYPV